VRSRVAVILQDPSAQLLQPTVAEEVAFAARNLDLPPDTVDHECRRWISAFGLDDVLEADPATLSAGRQQLVLLAGALAARPRLLVADEPGAHLDPEWRSRVLGSIESERRGGMAVVWATQDPRELAAASRVLVMGESATTSARPADRREEAETVDEALLELDVAPVSGEHGPRVDTPRGFELRIGSRGVQAVTGPNGAGKSVLLAAASGLEPIPQVRVTWKRETAWPPILVAQYPERLFFEEFVRDEVAFAARSRGMSRDEIEARTHECFATLNMDPDLPKRRLWELSGGARRLVEVVAALVAPAPLIALDEPSAGLDEIRRRGLADLLRDRAKCSAVLIASQDLEWLTMAGARLTEIGHVTVPISPSLSKKTD